MNQVMLSIIIRSYPLFMQKLISVVLAFQFLNYLFQISCLELQTFHKHKGLTPLPKERNYNDD